MGQARQDCWGKGFDQYEVMVDGSRRITLRNRKYLRKYTPFKCQPFAARPVLVRGTPISTPQPNGTPISTPQLQPCLQPRSSLGSEESAVDHHHVQIRREDGDGYVPQPAVMEDQGVTTPVLDDQVPHEPHGVGSPRRDQVPRRRSSGVVRRGSVEPAPSDIIEQEPISVNSEPNVRRSNRANKGKMPKALEDFEVEL